MAIQTKTFIGSTGNYLWTWKIEVIEEEGSILNRTSPVTINAYLGRASSQSYFAGKATLTYRAGNQTYSEEYKNYNSVTINGGAWYKIGTHTFTVENKGTTQNPTILDCRCDMSNANFSPGNATASGSIQLKVLHQAPDISFTLAETKLAGVAANQWILGLSGKRFTITATPYDGKRVTSYSVMQDNTQVGYSTTNQVNIDISKIVIKEGKINLRVQATDEVGAIGYKDVEYTNYIEYFKPSLIATSSMVKRNGQTSGKAKLYLTGIFYNATIGTVRNTVSLKFSYWVKDTTPSTTTYSIPFTPTTSSNNISINGWEMMKGTSLLTDLLKENAYIFKIIATDAFGQSSEPIGLSCSKGIWLMAKFKDRIDFQKITINNVDPFIIISDQERIVGTWMDKPLYQKTIQETTSALDTRYSPSRYGISDIKECMFDYAHSFVHYKSGTPMVYRDGMACMSLNTFLATNDYKAFYLDGGGSFAFKSANTDEVKWTITLLYTKTTD